MNWHQLRNALVIAVIAVSVSACSSSKQAVRESSSLAAAYEKVDSVKEQVVVAERDTIREVTTITVRLNEAGDTVKVAQVTERERLRDRSRHDMATYRTEVRVDTVYIERRDSVSSSRIPGAGIQSGGTALHTTLKWVFAIVVAVIVLVIVIKIRSR